VSREPTRRRLDPDARRAELLDAADRVLRKNPEARVEDIVAAARAAKGTFYVYFESWSDLIKALRERVLAQFYKRYPIVFPKRKQDWWALFDRLSAGFIDFTLEMEGLHQAVFHTPMAEPPGEEAVQTIALLLQSGAAAGAFATTDAAPLARLIFAMLHETVDAIEAGADRKRAMKALHDLLHRALAPDERSHRPRA